MLTDFVLGLWSSLRFVGCGIQIRFGPLWVANPLAMFSSVHAGSWLLLYFVDCVMLSNRYIGELCVLLAEFSLFWNCGLFPSSIGSLWLLLYPGFGCCCRVVLATLGPRTNMSCLVGLICAHHLFVIIPSRLCFFIRL